MHWKNKFLTSLLMSYFIIILISAILSISVLVSSLNLHLGEIEQNKKSMFQMVQQKMDTVFENLQNIFLSYEKSQTIRDYIALPEPGSLQQNQVVELFRNSTINTVSYNVTDSIFIYNKGNDYLLNNFGKYSLQKYYQDFYSGGTVTYEEWLALLNGDYVNRYIAFGEDIYYVNTFRVSDREANICVVIKKASLDEQMQPVWNGQKIKISIWNQDNAEIYCYEADDIRKSYTEFRIPSTITMLKYVFSYEKYGAFDAYGGIYILLGITVLLLIAISVYASIRYAQKNYGSVSRITELLNRNMAANINMDEKVYSRLEESLTGLFSQTKDMRRELDSQKDQLKSVFVSNLLTNKYMNPQSIRINLEKFHIRPVGENYYVALFYVDNIDNLFFEKNEGEYEEQIGLANFIIENISTEMLSENCMVLSNTIDDIYVAVINFDHITKEELSSIVMRCAQVVSNHFGFTFKAAFSAVTKDIADINSAYRDAVYTLDYQLTLLPKEILFYDEINKDTLFDDTDITAIQEKYIHLLQSGNYPAAIHLTEPVFEQIEKSSLNLSAVKCKMYALINMITEGLKSLLKAGTGVQKEEVEGWTARLLETKTFHELQKLHNEILTGLAERTEEEFEDKNAKLIREARAYVDENFHDLNLSVSAVADRFHLNSLYFSRLWTKYTGVYISDYITEKRMEHAKQLLLQTDMTVSSIAQKVGYYSDVVFIRNFKKNVGMTPGKFRSDK